MTAEFVVTILLSYFVVLLVIGWLVSRKSTSETFFTGNRDSLWYIVAFGMIGTSLSGVTFISIPGEVGNSGWTYLPLVFGNCFGYIIIGVALLPLFYKLNLVSIYTWLGTRFGEKSRLTGSFFFIISQLIGASFRLFLVAGILQLAFFDAIGVPFAATVFIIIGFIWIYTVRGGIKTIVWTDTFQTVFMLLSVVVTIVTIIRSLDLNLSETIGVLQKSELTDIWDFDWRSGHNTVKQFMAGIAITVVMNGLDQNMMQKNLTCRSLKECKTNMFSFSFFFLITNVLFLSLGALLYIYASTKGVVLPGKSDELFALLSLNYFGMTAGVLFLLGITAAAYSSVDSSLTSLTISFCIDFLKVDPHNAQQKKQRVAVHIAFSLLMFLVIVLFRELNNSSVITAVLTAAGYTYGPLLGLFAFGLITQYSIKERYVPLICLASPVLSYLLDCYSEQLFNGYKFGFEILVMNGLLCFIGLWLIRNKK